MTERSGFDSLRVLAQKVPAQHMDVAVVLALHSVEAEVGDQSKAVGAVPLTHAHGHLSHPTHVLPQLRLTDMAFRHHQQHHRHPVQTVAKCYHLFILVEDLSTLPVGYDFAKRTVSHEPAMPLLSTHTEAILESALGRVNTGKRPPAQELALG
jgi:hypothetical protein